jgi:DNA-binding protein YbaB
MTNPIDSSGLSGMLAEALSAVARLQGGGDGQEPLAGTGEAADGLISARVVAPGRVEGLQLDPRVMRMSAEQLAEQIESAVNAAFADLREQSAGVSGPADLSGLSDQLREVQVNAERQFSTFTASMADAQAQLVRRAGGQ